MKGFQMFTGPTLRNPSVMKHDFSKTPKVGVPRSTFRRSCGHKTMINSDYIYPIFCDEVLPGDSFRLKMSSVGRLNTLLYPLVDNLYLDFFFFYVPNRLLWDHWVDFMGEHKDGAGYQDTEYVVPLVEIDTSVAAEAGIGDSLADYFGLPTDEDVVGAAATYKVNALHFRAYNLIYNEFFRDQNLIAPVTVDTGDADSDGANYVLLKRGKRHDYFTSCLPWPQKGVAVDLPLGTTAPVITGADRVFGTAETSMYWWNPADGTKRVADDQLGTQVTTGKTLVGGSGPGGSDEAVPMNLWADLSNATAATINSLREAFQLQRMMEREALGGTRYQELIRSHFGVVSPDYRLQRPEYLGGGTKAVMIGAVAATNQSAAVDLGNLGAIGYHAQSGIGFSKSFTEHGVILGLVNLRGDLTYQKGIDRMWTRETKFDFYFPALAHLGEQSVLNKEIYFMNNGVTSDDLVFGYQERWAEYRYKNSLITSYLRSVAAVSFDTWHLSQDFAALPVLNQAFIEEACPVERVVADIGTPDFLLDMYFDVLCARCMPMYSVPGLIDHF